MRPFCRVSNSVLPTPLSLAHPARSRTLQTLRHSPRGSRFLPHQPQARRIARLYTITKPAPQRSAIDPVTLLLAISVTLGAAYTAEHYLGIGSPRNPTGQAQREKEQSTSATVETTSTRAYPDMPTQVPPGRPGNLTAEQEQKLKEFWLATLDVFGVDTDSADAASTAAASATGSSTPTNGTEEAGKPKKKRSLFKSKKTKEAEAGTSTPTEDASNDKHGQTKEFKEALASTSPEALRQAFWSMVKHDDPDALLLRFLRARKWDVHNALVMLIATMHWRADEMHVDDDIMLHGEEDALKRQDTDRDSADFLAQLRMGKSVLHGVDKEGRPVVTVRVRLHKGGEQTEKSLERYTVYTIETARMMLRGNVDTATIIFDMTSFSMANMDYTPVKFMIKCFEANYPESLGSVVVYKAPWVFNQIWRIIKGWLDPVVASKIHFAKNVDELEQYIPKDRILKELDGDEDWEYKYIEPVLGENKVMEDTASKEKIEGERKEMVLGYERDTIAWANGSANGDARGSFRDQLRDNYWRLDPFVRARSHYDREGLLSEGGKLNFYPQTSSSATATAPTTTQPTQATADDDVD